MKKESDFIPTISVVKADKHGNELKLQLDIDTKNDLINSLKFIGKNQFDLTSDALLLEKEIRNISPRESLDLIIKLDLEGDIASELFINTISEYLGLIKLPFDNKIICPCRNFSENDFNNFFANNGYCTLAEFNSKTLVGLDCNFCSNQILDRYINISTEKFSDKIAQSTIDEIGNWLSFQGKTYGEILGQINLIYLDFLKLNSLSKEEFLISDSDGFKFYFKSQHTDASKLSTKLQKLIFSRLGLLVLFERGL